ncbi:hypothetical protein RND71_023107 [Anisodus tanguticus]|uniref:K-box domain-containing protein n=1 Tax=Anisodus tanguticus TaxID=243964 RepID=A0AAE1RUW9_9SOLA|nr:hypothetical protein RND71_023107 [Anisodus tanguticus]
MNDEFIFSYADIINVDANIMKQLKEETSNMAKKIEILEISKRKLMGQGIGLCSMNELQEIDNQLERSLKKIRTRKEKLLLEENAKLSEKYGLRPKQAALEPQASPTQPAQQKEMANCSHNIQNSEADTDLFIGLPDICWSS